MLQFLKPDNPVKVSRIGPTTRTPPIAANLVRNKMVDTFLYHLVLTRLLTNLKSIEDTIEDPRTMWNTFLSAPLLGSYCFLFPTLYIFVRTLRLFLKYITPHAFGDS